MIPTVLENHGILWHSSHLCPAQRRAAVAARPGHSDEFGVTSKGTYSRASGQPASLFDYFIMIFPLINVKVLVEGLQGWPL